MQFNRKTFFRIMALVAVLSCLPSQSHGQVRTGVSYLKIIPGTRQLGMAGALTGAIDHTAAVFANPGATGFLREWQWSASYTRWIPDVYDAAIFYGRGIALPWSRRARMALGVSYLGIKDFDSTNGREPIGYGDEGLVTFSIGQPLSVLSEHLSFGGNLKFFHSSLAQFSASSVVFDAGLLFRTPKFSLLRSGLGIFDEAIFSAGIAVTQLGGALRFQSVQTPVPRTLRAGFALNTGSHRGVQMALSADYRRIRDEQPFTAIGIEFSWQHLLYWRGGYQFEKNNVLGHVAFGLSIGLDDTRSNLPGPNSAARIDLAKSESNIFFASPARASINYFPIRPERFSFVSPAPEAVVLSNSVRLQWQDARDPDLFDAVEYLALVAQSRADLERIVERLDKPHWQNLVELFRDSTAAFSMTLAQRTERHASTLLENMPCGEYYWTVVAYDKDRHFRVIERDGEHIARFIVGTPDLTVTGITPAAATGCESAANIVVANRGNAPARTLALSLYHGKKLITERLDSTTLAPGEQIVFEKIELGIVCENQPITAWINRDLTVPECDTTNNRLQQTIRSGGGHDLRISKSADRQVVQPGEKIHFTLTVSNNGCCQAREVTVVDRLPIFVRASDFHSPLPVDSTANDSLVWNLGTLPANARVQIRYAARIEPFTVRINFHNDRYRWNDRELIDYAGAQKDLDALAARLSTLLASHEAMRLHIAGYTSSPGSAAYNLQLSENRANTIRSQLTQRLKSLDPNFDETRITSEGRGEQPAYRKFVDDTRATRDAAGQIVISRQAKQRANRRVEIEFFNLPDIINKCEVHAAERDRTPANNRASVTVRIKS